MKKKIGTVYLVGAGPGNPELITVKGRKLLESCDFLVYDHLVHPALINLAAHAKKKFYVGKKGLSFEKMRQASIDQLLIRLARTGKSVVRLKGGDPFVFGRGGEEALQLVKHGVPIEIVPGITAGFGALAYAGIPVTHRGLASEVTFVTAHEDPAKKNSRLNWKALAELKGTLVIYMGVQMLPKIANCLMNFGKPGSTPTAVIHWGTTGNQKTIVSSLKHISYAAKHARIESPAVTVIGDVVSLREKLAWFEKKPLFGKTVIVTRSRTQASSLREQLENLGAHVIEFPTIEITPLKNLAPLDREIRRLKKYDWLVFTSENGVSHFFDRLHTLQIDVRELHGLKVIAIGSGTEARLQEFGLKADLMPPVFSSEGLFAELSRKHPIRNKKFLLLRTNIAPEYLPKSIEQAGGTVTKVSVYETRKPRIKKNQFERILESDRIDFVTFTSSSTAQNFFDALLRLGKKHKDLKTKFVSIGPVTSESIRRFGARVYREANPHNISGLVDVLRGEK